jgi:hypothetical protein
VTKHEELHDGTTVEDLVVEVNGKEHHGVLRIKRIDRTKSAFEVNYGAHHHQDTSLFPHSAQEQMRLHARFVLERLVKEDQQGSNSKDSTAPRPRRSLPSQRP